MSREEIIRRKIVHIILIYGYFIFFIAAVFGLIINLFFSIELFHNPFCQNLGAILIILGTLLVYWAQRSSANTGKIKNEEISVKDFLRGPYKIIRHPTYTGLFIMTLGLSLSLNSLPSFVLVIVAYLFVKLVFTKKEERFLEEKHGEIFRASRKIKIKK